MKARLRAVTYAAGFLLASAAQACGVCLDDKVASAYDHAVVTHALDDGKVVVFCELAGPHAPTALTSKGMRALLKVKGVDQASIRQGKDLAVVSFALDTSRADPGHAVAEMQRILDKSSTTAKLLKILNDQPAKPG